MQRIRPGGDGASASKSTKKLPKIPTKDGYIQGRSSQKEVTTNYNQRSEGNQVLSTKFAPEDIIARYRNMAVKSFAINPDDYSHTW